jgi:hypothetical protein
VWRNLNKSMFSTIHDWHHSFAVMLEWSGVYLSVCLLPNFFCYNLLTLWLGKEKKMPNFEYFILLGAILVWQNLMTDFHFHVQRGFPCFEKKMVQRCWINVFFVSSVYFSWGKLNARSTWLYCCWLSLQLSVTFSDFQRYRMS